MVQEIDSSPPVQPCTQRNIFGSHWLPNVQTLVARANMNFSENTYHTLQILLVSTEALFHKFLHHSHASPSSPSLFRLAPIPPQKKKTKIVADLCFDIFLVSL